MPRNLTKVQRRRAQESMPCILVIPRLTPSRTRALEHCHSRHGCTRGREVDDRGTVHKSRSAINLGLQQGVAPCNIYADSENLCGSKWLLRIDLFWQQLQALSARSCRSLARNLHSSGYTQSTCSLGGGPCEGFEKRWRTTTTSVRGV